MQTTGRRPGRRPGGPARRAGRVREGGAAGRARRPRRPGRALGQGPAVGRRRPAWCWRACPSAPIHATPWWVAPSRTLATGATVATGSVRRRAQLAWLRPDLTFCDLRGNMATRLERAQQVGAGVLALAALERLGLTGHVAEVLDPRTLLPQVGQGALAVECRDDDHAVLRAPGARSTTRRPMAAVAAERAFLGALGGGCTLPLGALGRPRRRRCRGSPSTACLASRDGRILLRRSVSGPATEPEELGRRARPCPARRLRRPLARRLGRSRDPAGPADPGWAAGSAERDRGGAARPMTVYLVGAGPGDPGLLTRRGAELLGRADVVLFDRLVDPRLLDLAPAGRPAHRRGQAAGAASRTRTRSTPCCSSTGERGRTVVRLKGGDPFVFGRGGEEAEVLLARRASPSRWCPASPRPSPLRPSAGVPVTHRGCRRR